MRQLLAAALAARAAAFEGQPPAEGEAAADAPWRDPVVGTDQEEEAPCWDDTAKGPRGGAGRGEGAYGALGRPRL